MEDRIIDEFHSRFTTDFSETCMLIDSQSDLATLNQKRQLMQMKLLTSLRQT